VVALFKKRFGSIHNPSKRAFMDIVYFLRHSAAGDMEIRYSLRSVARHFPGVGKVWVFGDWPPFLSGDESIIQHVPHEYVARATGVRTPVVNMFQMMFLSSLIPDLSREYLWFCDDYILLDELTLEAARRIRFLEVLDEIEGNRGRGMWVDCLWRTYELLKRLKLPRLNFETHVPTCLRRKWVFDAYCDLRDFVTEDRWYGMLGPTAIMNHALAHNDLRPVMIREEGTRAGFWRKPPTYNQVVNECRGKLFLNFDDDAFGDSIRRFLEERFPDPCRYEK
jgi:hypothetical protein